MKDFAFNSIKGGWTIIGARDSKKAAFTLKHPEKGNITLSEKDIKPIMSLLGILETTMKEDRNEGA